MLDITNSPRNKLLKTRNILSQTGSLLQDMYIAFISVILVVVYIHRKGGNVFLFASYFREERMQLIIFLVRFFLPNLKILTAKC